ncbi:MAG TPA: ABC transporter permease [Candidatus Limnocylindrales bacterium]|nr:ABC transporter permease [Candidatus Limnocylindrales bacterium]
MEERTNRSRRRRVLALVLFVIGVVVVWEGAKWLAGDPWRLESIGYFHEPPFHVLQLSDRQLPHLWDIAAAFGQPFQRNAEYSLGNYLVEQAAYTWAEALLGFLLGAGIGIVLASVLVHFKLFERAIVPYVVASQTIPIVALAPLIVVSFGRGLTSVVIIATYLTFFPVTISVMRGLRSPDPRAVELMRSYAASKWDVYRKVRLPASVPYLFTGLKIAAAASIVGTIIGEGPGGVPQGLGRAILNFNQQYITGPEKLWATILIAAAVGILFFLIVRVAEIIYLRRHGAQSVAN